MWAGVVPGTARPFQDAWLVSRPTSRRGAPLMMVRSRDRESMDPESWRWMIVLHEGTGRPINVFVLAGSSRAVAYNHRRKVWTVNPELVTRTSWENQREGLDRLRTTDRAGADEAARQFGTTLPDETELRRLLVAARTD